MWLDYTHLTESFGRSKKQITPWRDSWKPRQVFHHLNQVLHVCFVDFFPFLLHYHVFCLDLSSLNMTSSQGKKYPCPLGSRVKNDGPKHQSAAAKRLAQMQAAEEDFCFHECRKLADGITNPITSTSDCTRPPQPRTIDDTLSEDDEPFETIGSRGEHVDENDIGHNFLSEPHVPPNYTARRVEEEERWNSVISLMFVAYMRCKQLTLDWGHVIKWNHDWKKQCTCPPSHRRQRDIDTVDLLSE